MDPAMEAEFDQLAAWTEDVVARNGPDMGIPAACRGSGNPAALAWLAGEMAISATTRLLDVGGGLGGPAAWVAQHYSARVVLAEPMRRAAAGAHRLFGVPSTVAWADELPFPAGSFDAAWALGVLDTTGQKAGLLAGLHRVVRPLGHLGLIVYELSRDGRGGEPPDGNSFPTSAQTTALLEGGGWRVAAQLDASRLPAPPLSWQIRTDHVSEEVADAHRGDATLRQINTQDQHMSILLTAGAVAPRLYHAVRTDR
jgi:SAM-dependent methyltransferase